MIMQIILIAIFIFLGLLFTVAACASVIDKWNTETTYITQEFVALLASAVFFTTALIILADIIVTKLGPVG